MSPSYFITVGINLQSLSGPGVTVSQDTQNGHRFLLTTPRGPLNRLLLNISLLDSSSSSKAVLNSLMALSCLYLGAYQQASVYKLRATSFLRVSLDPESSVVVAISNLASSMLLYLYEVAPPEISSLNKQLIAT